MSSVVDVLRDIIDEVQTASSTLEYDDPIIDSLQYVENMTKRAIEMLGETP